MKCEPSFELFQHTADVGIRVVAPDLPGLAQPAAQGLYAVIGSLCPAAGPLLTTQFAFDEPGPAEALRAFLAELLYLFETQKLFAEAIRVHSFLDGHLRAAADMAHVDSGKSVLSTEVKAITYHGLDAAERTGETRCWEASIIVDI